MSRHSPEALPPLPALAPLFLIALLSGAELNWIYREEPRRQRLET
jgi:hypothetical protein